MNGPRPRSLLTDQAPPIPDGLLPAAASQALVHGLQAGVWCWTMLRKVSYGMGDDGALYRVAEQKPIHREYALHDPLPDWLGSVAGAAGSYKCVPEARASQSGTDVIIRGHAASSQPVRSMLAGVAIGGYLHKLRIFGARRSILSHGSVRFTEPEWFERMPLRSELAYGGVDALALKETLAVMQSSLGPEEWRRGSAFLKDVLPQLAPIAYARNPIGLGYVADGTPEALHDIELPRIELERDLLTPERFAQGNGAQWLSRPVSAGTDFMAPSNFPRTALLGLPPLGFAVGTRDCAEVAWGQLHADFSRGNLMSAPDDQLHDMIHPDAGRCASIGLRLPWLEGRENLSLLGLRADRPRWDIALPAERPVFEVPGQGLLRTAMWQMFVDVDARRMELLWGASWQAGRALMPGEAECFMAQVRTRVEALS